MGIVNTGITKYCNCYRTLESINPLFNADTPIYLVVDEMKMDKAEYDVDVTLTAPVAYFWKSYPENGKTHVEITTTTNSEGKYIRTVKCTCESGRVYINTFKLRDDHIYRESYNTYDTATYRDRGLYMDSVEYIYKHAVDPKIKHIDLGITRTYLDDIFDFVYMAESNYGNKFDFRGTSLIEPYQLITQDYIFEYARCLCLDNAAASSTDPTILSIPTLTLDQKITLLSTCGDVRSIPYLMLNNLYSDNKFFDSWTSIYDDGYNIYDVVLVYELTRKWDYSGWVCSHDIDVDVHTPINPDETDIAENTWVKRGVLCVNAVDTYGSNIRENITNEKNRYDVHYSSENLAFKSGLHDHDNVDIGITPMVDIIEEIKDLSTNLSCKMIPFKPIPTAKKRVIVHKAICGGINTVYDLIRHIPSRFVKIIGDINIAEFDMVALDITYDGETNIFTIESNAISNIATCGVTKCINDKTLLTGMPTEKITSAEEYPATHSNPTYIPFNAFLDSHGMPATVANIKISGRTVEEMPDGDKTTANPSTLISSTPTLYTSNHNLLTFATYEHYTYLHEDGTTSALSEDGTGDIRWTSNMIQIPDNGDSVRYRLYIPSANTNEVLSGTLCLYDENKNFISYTSLHTIVDTISTNRIDVEINCAGAAYVRFMVLNADMSTASFHIYDRDAEPGDGASVNFGTTLMSMVGSSVRDTICNIDGTWCVDKRILKTKLYIASAYSSSTGIYRDVMYLGNTLCTYVYDRDASTPSAGIYVFHIGTSVAQHTTDGTWYSYGILPTHSSYLMCPTAITTLNIPSGSEVNAGATPISDVVEYAIFVDTEKDSITYTIENNKKEIAINCKREKLRELDTFDRYGIHSPIPQTVTIAMRGEIDSTDPRKMFKNKIAEAPIEFYYVAPFFFYENLGCMASYTMISSNSSSDHYVMDYIKRYIPLSYDVQSQLNNLPIYPGGIIDVKFDTEVACKYEIEYYVDNSVKMTELENKFGGLSFVKLTQEEYDNITFPDPNTVYFIV